jgi:hypothetical protein
MWRKIIALAALTIFIFVAVGCEREGPAEKAGKKMDEFMKGVGEEVEKLKK